MTKPFLTYEQQIRKLADEKHLIIADPVLAENALRDIGYFTLIGGYKAPFRNPMTRVYEGNTTFEDILALYHFDNGLRELIFRYLCQVERKTRNLLSYAFCEQYGEAQVQYLNTLNYDCTRRNQQGINKLIAILNQLANQNTEYEYLNYQRRVYHNVPLWVTMHAMTFGQISKMYSFLKPNLRSKISKNFPHVNDRELEQYLRVLVLYRNACAHNERIFSHKVYSEIPDTVLHEKLGIPRTGSQYTMGKKDLLAVIIALRYLLPMEDFVTFKSELSKLIDAYLRKSQRISEPDLLSAMGIPQNWKKIVRYKL